MLGPTSDAASLHVMGVYYQIQSWKGRTDLELSKWGWILKNDFVLPAPMTKDPGPSNIAMSSTINSDLQSISEWGTII